MRVLICGGGIGGLTTALCCHHFGHEAIVLERAALPDEGGAGIQLPPNALKVLAHLGVNEALRATAFEPYGLEARMGESRMGEARMREAGTGRAGAEKAKTGRARITAAPPATVPPRSSGPELFSIPVREAAQRRWGERYLHIHRADYIRVLENALRQCASEALMPGHEAVDHAQSSSGVTVRCRNGREFEGDVLVGMDGIHSALRTQMRGGDRPRFSGNVAWRCVVPIVELGAHAPPPTACVWMGRGRHAVTYQLRQGTLANFVGVVETPDWDSESWVHEGSAAQALADFANWDPVITTLIEKADRVYQWALFDRPPLDRWTEGRVILLGDAAHPMLPFLAQGAAMAVEDAWVLARGLGVHEGDIAADLRLIEAARLPRTSRVQAKSRANRGIFHRRTPLGQLCTYGPMWLLGRVAPHLMHARMDWLYGHDVTRA